MAGANPSKEVSLEQKVLQVLQSSTSSKKAYKIAEECSVGQDCRVPRADVNRVLHALKNRGKVTLLESGYWCLSKEDITDKVFPDTSLQRNVALEEKVLQVLQSSTSSKKAYKIAEECSVGQDYRVSRADVNRVLHALKNRGKVTLLESGCWSLSREGSLDEDHSNASLQRNADATVQVLQKEIPLVSAIDISRLPEICQPGKCDLIPAVIIQNSPTNVIYQGGEKNTVSIGDSKVTQIGSVNSMNQLPDGGKGSDSGFTLPTVQSDSQTSCPPGGLGISSALLAQNITILEAELQNVQIGNENQMDIRSHGAFASFTEDMGRQRVPEMSEGAAVSAKGSNASIDVIYTTLWGLPGVETPVQNIHIQKSQLKNVAVGSGNKMDLKIGEKGLASEGWNCPFDKLSFDSEAAPESSP
ncbi:Z-DNA-binding protein 1 isoform X2 [Tachyglossus aculeatus]|uniref:Z-DNA-binding protein 1 isoform X2 n=1 Tax=Tachyglossus aculeatus TaxID=9261 RepID=UPI0018F55F03|nr:Z-DNA-binding protein 1 isoform X2 [Tachyglossus aculeatus]